MSDSISLAAAISQWVDRTLEELPAGVRQRVERDFPSVLWKWDELTPAMRRHVAAAWDAQHPAKRHDKHLAKEAFREGFKSVSVPDRNKRNARKPRPSRQRVSNDEILRVRNKLQRMGAKPHKQISEAYRRLAPPMTLRAFRKRWNALPLKKGT